MGRDSTRVQLHKARQFGFWQAKARGSTTYRLTAEPNSQSRPQVTTTRHAKYLEDLRRVCRKLKKIPPHQTETASSCSRDSATILLYPRLSANPRSPRKRSTAIETVWEPSRDSNPSVCPASTCCSTTLHTMSKGASTQCTSQIDGNIRPAVTVLP